MSVLKRMFGVSDSVENRSSELDPVTAAALGGVSAAGVTITPALAEGLPAVFACSRVIAENVAGLPVRVTGADDSGGATDHPLHNILNVQSAEGITAYECREALVLAMLLRGNAFALVERDDDGGITGLIPLDPDSVTVERLAGGRLRYKVSAEGRTVRTLLQGECLHLTYRRRPGELVGRSPIQICREALGAARLQQEHDSYTWRNGGQMQGYFKTHKPLRDEEFYRMRESIQDSYSGPRSSGRKMILDGGVEWVNMSLSMVDAEFIAARKLSREDICAIFGVPPSMLGITESVNRSNATEAARGFARSTLRNLATRLDQAYMVQLLTPAEQARTRLRHDLTELSRAEPKERSEFYAAMLSSGAMTVNEVRSREGLPPVDGGDVIRVPLNMGEPE